PARIRLTEVPYRHPFILAVAQGTNSNGQQWEKLLRLLEPEHGKREPVTFLCVVRYVQVITPDGDLFSLRIGEELRCRSRQPEGAEERNNDRPCKESFIHPSIFQGWSF